MRTHSIAVVVLCMALIAMTAPINSAQTEKAVQLISAKVDKGPVLDGNADDAAWTKAKPIELVALCVMPKIQGTSSKVRLASVHTDQEVFFLAVWEDSAPDLSHKTWTWNKDKNAYEEGPDREDMFALAFELSGT